MFIPSIIFKRRLASILMLFYMLLFALALVLSVNGNLDLMPMAFDSGGVTTGPITVPFIKKWECSKRHRELCLHYPRQM